MNDRNNLIFMMTLGAGVVALLGTTVSSEIFRSERPKHMGYVVEGVEAEGGEGGGEAGGPEVPIATLLPTADVAKGAEVFKKCASCHNVAQGGPAGVGPNLYGVVGAKHAHMPGFSYSEGLAAIQGPWSFDALNAWLKSPKSVVAGTKMSFAGLSKPEDRANVIAYLNAQGSNLPIPPAPKGGDAAAAPTLANAKGAAPAAGVAGAPAASAPANGTTPAAVKVPTVGAGPGETRQGK